MDDTQKPTFESESRKIYTGHLDAYQKEMYEAIENNCLDVLTELYYENTPRTHRYSYFDSFTHQGPFVSVHFQIAARKGYFDILKYIIKICGGDIIGCNIDGDACDDAAACGHLNCLRLAYEFGGAPIKIETFYNAAEYGHVDCLQYAINNEYEYDRNEHGKIMCAKAAKNGHINCLKLLREEEMHWDEQTCKSAAECALKYNQVECLEYAYKNGCPYSKEVLSIIVQKILIPKWRAYVKNRSIVYYWMERSAQTSCAENGRARIEDMNSFENDFNSLIV
jgi:hypothetical protein